MEPGRTAVLVHDLERDLSVVVAGGPAADVARRAAVALDRETSIESYRLAAGVEVLAADTEVGTPIEEFELVSRRANI